MKKMRELDRLRSKVAMDRQRVEALEARWLVPLLAFVSGAFVPPVTRSRSANPLVQVFLLVRDFFMRALRFVVFRNLWEILRRHDALDIAAHARRESGQ